MHATCSLISIQTKLVYVLQHADPAEFAPWRSVEKPCVEKFCQRYTLLSSGLSVLYNVEIYKTSGEIFSMCKWMLNHRVRVELGRYVQVQKTDNSLHNESDGLKSFYWSSSCFKTVLLI